MDDNWNNMVESIASTEELRALKAEEARDRMQLLAAGESGDWRWPENVPICPPVRPDESWLLELELAGD